MKKSRFNTKYLRKYPYGCLFDGSGNLLAPDGYHLKTMYGLRRLILLSGRVHKLAVSMHPIKPSGQNVRSVNVMTV